MKLIIVENNPNTYPGMQPRILDVEKNMFLDDLERFGGEK